MTDSEDAIKLNVGGVRFVTTRAVLTAVPGSMLGAMFGSCDAMLRAEDDGSYTIHREEGKTFHLILEFLGKDINTAAGATDLKRRIRGLKGSDRQSFLSDVDFFGLGSVVVDWLLEDAVFLPGPNIIECRNTGAAVRLGRRVFVFGGFELRGSRPLEVLDATEVLDLDSMQFTFGPKMSRGKKGCAAVSLDERRILVLGGSSAAFVPSSETEILNVRTMTFEPGPRMLRARSHFSVVAIDRSRLLVVGGAERGERGKADKSTEVLNLETMEFSPGPDMLSERTYSSSVLIDPNTVLVVGYSKQTEIMDIKTMSFRPGPDMSTEREGSFSIVPLKCLPDEYERFMVVGGTDRGHSKGLATTEVLDPLTMTFKPGPLLQKGRFFCTAVPLEEGIMVLGGSAKDVVYSGSVPVLSSEVLVMNPATSSSSLIHQN